MRLLLVITIFILSCTLVCGQRFMGSASIGISASQIDGDESSGYNKLGLRAGVNVEIFFGNPVGIKSGVFYVGRGAKESGDDNNIGSFKTHLDYIEIPLLLKYVMKNKIYLEGGASLAYLLRAKREVNGYEISSNLYSFQDTDLSLLAGIGYKFSEKFSTGLLLSYSVLYMAEPPRQFSNVLNLFLTYHF